MAATQAGGDLARIARIVKAVCVDAETQRFDAKAIDREDRDGVGRVDQREREGPVQIVKHPQPVLAIRDTDRDFDAVLRYERLQRTGERRKADDCYADPVVNKSRSVDVTSGGDR
ncbi:MAG: hypothetical protein ABI277_05140 [Burkholderiaceae bacterium]